MFKLPKYLPKAVIGQVTEIVPQYKMVRVKVEDLKLDSFLKMVRFSLISFTEEQNLAYLCQKWSDFQSETTIGNPGGGHSENVYPC